MSFKLSENSLRHLRATAIPASHVSPKNSSKTVYADPSVFNHAVKFSNKDSKVIERARKF